MKTLLAFIVSPVLICDRSDRLIYLNPAGQTAFDRKLRDVMGQEIGVLLDEAGGIVLKGGLDRLRQGEKEVTLQLPAGDRFFSATLSPVRADDQTYAGAVVHFVDATSDQKFQRMKNAVLSAVVNEVFSSLISISNALRDLTRLIEDPRQVSLPDSERKAWLHRLAEAGAGAGAVQARLVDLTRFELGESEGAHGGLYRQSGPLAPLLRQAMQSVRPFAEKKKIRIELLREDASMPVVCDMEKFNFVLITLLSFCLRHTPVGGLILVGAERVEWPEPMLWITLVFRGFGFFEEEIEHIIEGEHDAAEGISFPVLSRIAEAHGGALTLESLPDVGTACVIRLPQPASA